MPEIVEEQVHALLADLRVRDLLAAEKPQQALEAIGCEIALWEAYQRDKHFGVIRLPDIGWVGVETGLYPSTDGIARAWSSDPSLRLSILFTLLRKPLSEPVRLLADVPMALAGERAPRRDEITTDWDRGMLMLMLLAHLPAEQSEAQEVLIGLAYPQMSQALRGLEHWIANSAAPKREFEAGLVIGAAKRKRFPTTFDAVYPGLELTHVPEEAAELLTFPYEEWETAASLLIEEWLRDEESFLYTEMRQHKARIGWQGPLHTLP